MDDWHPPRNSLRDYLAAKRQAESADLDFAPDESQAEIHRHVEGSPVQPPCPRCNLILDELDRGVSDSSAESIDDPSAGGDRGTGSTLELGPDVPSLADNYRLIEEIDRGGFGVVYKAIQIGLERVVAIKEGLHGHLERDRREAVFAA